MVGEQQLDQPEHERAREGDLEGDQDVLAPGSEQDEERGGRGGDPFVHTCSAHDHAKQHGGEQVQPDRQRLIGQIRPQPEDEVQQSEDQRRQCDEMVTVPTQKAVNAEAAPGQEVPFVAEHPEEPHLPAVHDVDHDPDELRDDECRDRELGARWPRQPSSAVTTGSSHPRHTRVTRDMQRPHRAPTSPRSYAATPSGGRVTEGVARSTGDLPGLTSPGADHRRPRGPPPCASPRAREPEKGIEPLTCSLRTLDLLITSELLCRLSYPGGWEPQVTSRSRAVPNRLTGPRRPSEPADVVSGPGAGRRRRCRARG